MAETAVAKEKGPVRRALFIGGTRRSGLGWWHTRTLAPVLVVASLLAAPVAADAANYCVGAPNPCPGGSTVFPGTPAGLQSALTAANDNPGGDTVRIEEDTFTAPTASGFTHSSGAEIDIIGQGSSATVIKPANVNAGRGLDINGGGIANSTVSGIGVTLSNGDTQVGMDLAGLVADDVFVEGPA